MARFSSTTPAERRGNPLRTFLLAILVLLSLMLIVLIGGAWLLQQRLDQNRLRMRVEAQVEHDTGRSLSLGALRLRLLPVPTVEADDLSLSDWPGGSEPGMLSARHLSAHLALLPLLRREVRLEGVTLEDAALLLERRADGSANWQMHPLPDASNPPTGDTPAGRSGGRWRVTVNSVRLSRASLRWQDLLHGWTGQVMLTRLDGSGLAGSAPVLSLSGDRADTGFEATLRTGPLQRLQQPHGLSWPVAVQARLLRNNREAARLELHGGLTDPARGRGYTLTLAAQADRLDLLNSLFPHAKLPPVAELSLRAGVADLASPEAATGRPELRQILLRTGSVPSVVFNRERWLRGLEVRSLSLDAAGRETPLAVSVTGIWQGAPATLHGDAGSLAAWQNHALPADAGTVPVSLVLGAGEARARVDGTASRAGVDLQLAVSAPQSRQLLPVGPALEQLSARGRLRVGGRDGSSLSDLVLESRQLQLSGTLTLRRDRRPVVSGVLASSHADLDALRAGWRDTPAAAAADGQAGTAIAPRTSAAATATRPGTPAPRPAGVPASERPDEVPVAAGEHALPFHVLDQADLQLKLDAADVLLSGMHYRPATATLSLRNGVLSDARVVATGPAGPVSAELTANASAHSLAVTASPVFLPGDLVSEWIGHPGLLFGTIELAGNLHGSGGSREEMLRSLSGNAGLSTVDGSADNAALARLIGRAAALPASGRTALRCLAVPAQFANGAARLDTLALETGRFGVSGHGSVGLTTGILDLHLLPRLFLGGIGGASLPVHVGGTLDAPAASLDPSAPGNRYALTIGPSTGPPDPCPAALAAARFGSAGPAATAAVPGRKAPKPIDILRSLGLFH